MTDDIVCQFCEKPTVMYWFNITHNTEYPVCAFHLMELKSLELTDDLARDIYVKEWLIPQKKK